MSQQSTMNELAPRQLRILMILKSEANLKLSPQYFSLSYGMTWSFEKKLIFIVTYMISYQILILGFFICMIKFRLFNKNIKNDINFQ